MALFSCSIIFKSRRGREKRRRKERREEVFRKVFSLSPRHPLLISLSLSLPPRPRPRWFILFLSLCFSLDQISLRQIKSLNAFLLLLIKLLQARVPKSFYFKKSNLGLAGLGGLAGGEDGLADSLTGLASLFFCRKIGRKRGGAGVERKVKKCFSGLFRRSFLVALSLSKKKKNPSPRRRRGSGGGAPGRRWRARPRRRSRARAQARGRGRRSVC